MRSGRLPVNFPGGLKYKPKIDFPSNVLQWTISGCENSDVLMPPGLSTELREHLAQLAREDLLLIETYLQRRNDLDWLVREKMAEEIATRVRRKTGLVKGPEQSDDDLLEAVARRIRENARF